MTEIGKIGGESVDITLDGTRVISEPLATLTDLHANAIERMLGASGAAGVPEQ